MINALTMMIMDKSRYMYGWRQSNACLMSKVYLFISILHRTSHFRPRKWHIITSLGACNASSGIRWLDSSQGNRYHSLIHRYYYLCHKRAPCDLYEILICYNVLASKIILRIFAGAAHILFSEHRECTILAYLHRKTSIYHPYNHVYDQPFFLANKVSPVIGLLLPYKVSVTSSRGP